MIMNWGKWIAVAFISFAGFIGVLVYVCVREDISLVSKDYYQEELRYEDQITRLNNTNLLTLKPHLEISGDSLVLLYSDLYRVQEGKVKLFRPSDAELDRTFELTNKESVIRYFDVATLPSGMYKARMTWTMDGKEYFLEKVVQL